MKASLRASLEEAIQKWLERNDDEITSTSGIWQDDGAEEGTAARLAAGAVAVFDGMEHQRVLADRYEQ